MKYALAFLTGAMLSLLIWQYTLHVRVINLEKQQLRIEQEYQRVITQNEQLKRINEQNIRLLSQGGWNNDEVSSICTDN